MTALKAPKISMILPARGRPNNLRASVDSVFQLAAKPDDVEMLVRLDNDDRHLQEEVSILSRSGVTVFHGTRLGYGRMHDYYNGLAARANGDWIFLWNDDIEMRTQGWDTLVCECPLFSIQFPRRDVTKTTDYTLPVTGRPVFEALGRLSDNPYVDAWLSDVSAFAGTSVIRDDIEFVHHRLNDETLREQATGGGTREWAKFGTPEQRASRRADMDKIMAAPGWAERFSGWDVETIDHVGIDYINLAAGERKAGAARLRGRK